MTDKGLISKIYKQFIQLNIKKKTTWLKSERKIWIDVFPKKTYRWPMAHEKVFNITNHQRNASKTTVRYHFTPVRMAIIKKTTKNQCLWGCGKMGTLVHCWWECKLVQPLWKMVWRFLKEVKLGTSLVAQWLRIRLPMQETQVQVLVLEGPTCHKQLSLYATTTEPAL